MMNVNLVGISFYNTYEGLSTLKAGDELLFTHEPTNPYDNNAVVVTCAGKKIGYLAKGSQAQQSVVEQGEVKGNVSEIGWMETTQEFQQLLVSGLAESNQSMYTTLLNEIRSNNPSVMARERPRDAYFPSHVKVTLLTDKGDQPKFVEVKGEKYERVTSWLSRMEDHIFTTSERMSSVQLMNKWGDKFSEWLNGHAIWGNAVHEISHSLLLLWGGMTPANRKKFLEETKKWKELPLGIQFLSEMNITGSVYNGTLKTEEIIGRDGFQIVDENLKVAGLPDACYEAEFDGKKVMVTHDDKGSDSQKKKHILQVSIYAKNMGYDKFVIVWWKKTDKEKRPKLCYSIFNTEEHYQKCLEIKKKDI